MKMPVKILVNKMMYHPIADCGLVDIARFRVRDVKHRIWTVNIGLVFKVCIEAGDIGCELGLKFYNVLFVFLAAQKSLPRQE